MRILLAVAFGMSAACEPVVSQPETRSPVAPPPSTAVSPEPRASTLEPRFVAAVQRAATEYTAWGRVDDELRAAPIPCAAAGPPPAPIRLSAAESGPHGRKLFYLSASDRDRYLRARTFEPGFTVVKESYKAVAIGSGEPATAAEVAADGKRYTRGPRSDLFVMTKLADRDGTDEGWIYGTVAVDGKVTGAGLIASCMECHDQNASHERLFGLASATRH